MNYAVVVYILGWIMELEAAFMLLPCAVSAIYGEGSGLAFLWVALGSALFGTLIVLKKPKNMRFYLREGFVTVALSWILMSVIGCLPFVINGDIPSFTDALFEMISGFTTTGATILSDIEALSKCSLFWRSFSHWIGGMGVLVFLLAIVPMAGGSHMNLMKAESPGPSVGKLVPKVRQTAKYLYIIYIALTVLEMIFLLAGGMSLFGAITTAFGTAGTGGFAIWNDGFVSTSPYLQWVVTIFMILFGVNFGFYFLLFTGRIRDALKFEEVRVYFVIILVSATIIFINLYHFAAYAPAENIRHAFFQVASIMTTTGFASTDFNMWPETSRTVLVILMFVGACAGSTGGGIKVSRFIIAVKTFFKEIISYLHPRSVKKIKVEGKVLEHEIIRATNVYFITYLVIFATSVLLISLENKDLVTNFTAVAATFNNIGPGFSLVGPMENFAHFSVFSKYILMFNMLAGRLEIFPLLLLFCPIVWKRKRV
ncbi:MAG: TrkH family potassium uptake protein [Wujia sp.]